MLSGEISKDTLRDKIINKERITQILMILVGNLIYSIGVNLFIAPNKLLSGGVAGISLLIQYITNIPSGYSALLINIPIFCFGFKMVDREFGILSLVGMLSLSFFLVVTENISKIILIDDMMIACICGGVLCGLGMAIIFLNRASEGGIDIIAIIVKKKYGIKLGSMCFILNAVIVLFGLYISNLTITIYTLISLFIKSYVVDKVIASLNEKNLIIIISDKHEEIKTSFINVLGRGVTFLHGEGAYTGVEKKVIYSIINPNQVQKAKELLLDIDSEAVVSILNVSEAHGKGFKQLSF
ncbi:MAG: YitT family protein [Clostridium sp.]|nr:YitT family protein [Clostridium sp.]